MALWQYIWSLWNTSISQPIESIFLKEIYPSKIIRWYIKTRQSLISYIMGFWNIGESECIKVKKYSIKKKDKTSNYAFPLYQSLMICTSSVLFMFFNLVLALMIEYQWMDRIQQVGDCGSRLVAFRMLKAFISVPIIKVYDSLLLISGSSAFIFFYSKTSL